MKWYKVCNRISLLLHALCSTAGYFLIEAISRHSFSAAWTYMTTKPLIFAYNAALIFLACADSNSVAFAGHCQWSDSVKQGYSVYRTGPSSSDRWNGSVE